MKGQLLEKFVTTQKSEVEEKEKEIESRGMLVKLKAM